MLGLPRRFVLKDEAREACATRREIITTLFHGQRARPPVQLEALFPDPSLILHLSKVSLQTKRAIRCMHGQGGEARLGEYLEGGLYRNRRNRVGTIVGTVGRCVGTVGTVANSKKYKDYLFLDSLRFLRFLQFYQQFLHRFLPGSYGSYNLPGRLRGRADCAGEALSDRCVHIPDPPSGGHNPASPFFMRLSW